MKKIVPIVLLLVLVVACSKPYNRELDGVWQPVMNNAPSFEIRNDSIYYLTDQRPNQFKLGVEGNELKIDYSGYIFQAIYELKADTLHIEDSTSVSVFIRVRK